MAESKQSDVQLVERLRQHVDVLAELIGPRHVGRPKALESAATYVERQFLALGDEVERQTYDVEGTTVANLVVERSGERSPDSIIVLGAHYDSIPATPGADDNASAVAVLIEVARLLRGRHGQRTIRFVAFACEEPPHFYTDTMGSQVYARRCRTRSERVVGMLCLEMVGFFTDEPRSQATPHRNSSLVALALPSSRPVPGGRRQPPITIAGLEVSLGLQARFASPVVFRVSARSHP